MRRHDFGWRILWLVGIPISVILVLLDRWIPEIPPRFLLQHGRDSEARATMERYGAAVIEIDDPDLEVEDAVHGRYGQLFRSPFAGLTAVLVSLALGSGVVQCGLQQWIPPNLKKLGYNEVDAAKVLRYFALIGFPPNLPIAMLYGFWSSKKTIIIMASLTAAALLGFTVADREIADNSALPHLLLIVGHQLAHRRHRRLRLRDLPHPHPGPESCLTAAGTKAGGLLILAAVAAAVAPPSIRVTALLGAVPIVTAVGLITLFGIV